MEDHPALIDHIGVDLWQTSRAYEAAMYAAITEAGFDDLTLADSDVLVFVGPNGTRASDIAKGRAITKQAVQEQIARLVKRGYLDVTPDPEDRRAKRVTLSAKGRAMAQAFVSIKEGLHAQIRETLGEDGLKNLKELLERSRQALAAPSPPQ
ncbi:MAG: MarR family winged helix-turn-helix transcriptional regulator [Pseudomonadota bacterium]